VLAMKRRAPDRRELPSMDEITLDYERMFAKIDDPSALTVQGTILGRRGDFEDALQCFDKAIEIDPNFVDAWFNKGIVLINQQEISGALLCIQKSAELDSGFFMAWLKMGYLNRKLGHYDEAHLCLNKCIELQHDSIGALEELLELYLDQGDQEKALEAIDKALEIDPELSHLKVRKGEILSSLGRNSLSFLLRRSPCFQTRCICSFVWEREDTLPQGTVQ
jgi:tetratricopeptide (TPR) repeat protein